VLFDSPQLGHPIAWVHGIDLFWNGLYVPLFLDERLSVM
jgi:hypothetical protein